MIGLTKHEYVRWTRKEQREPFGKCGCGRLVSMCSANEPAVGNDFVHR